MASARRVTKRKPRHAGKVIWCDRGWMPVYYGFCPNEAAWKAEMRRLCREGATEAVAREPYPTQDARATHFVGPSDKTLVIVTIGHHIDRKRDVSAVAALIVHEAMHVWRAMRKNIGEDDPSAEFEAYAIQAIFTGLYDAYLKTRGKR